SASAKTCFAIGNWAERSLPMPTYWDPCPGKTNARLLFVTPLALLPPAFDFRFIAQRFDFRFEALPEFSWQPFFAIHRAQSLGNMPVHMVLDRVPGRPYRVFDCR